MNLAETLTEDPGRLFGLTVTEWGFLLPMLAALVVSVIRAYKGAQDGHRLDAVLHALEEVNAAHPAAVQVVRKVARDKAVEMGQRVSDGLRAKERKVEDAVRAKLRGMVPLLLVSMFLAGCVPQQAVTHAREQYAIHESYVDMELGEPAAGIVADAADAWAAQVQALDGGTLPQRVLARVAARRVAASQAAE